MISDDQVAELFAQANPVPNLEALDAEPAIEHSPTSTTSERGSGMTAVKTGGPATAKSRGPLTAAALLVALAAVVAVPLLLRGGEPSEIATPVDPKEAAIQTAEDFMAALTRGDADGALALMEVDIQESLGVREGLEFFAALPGSKTLSDCTTQQGPIAITVRCTTNYTGPLMQATGEHSEGTFTVKDGLLTTMFVPGSREEAAEAFYDYASQTRPEAFEQVCSPYSYELGSVLTQGTGFAFAGPCGELWAQLAEDVAAWVEAGRPPLTEEDRP